MNYDNVFEILIAVVFAMSPQLGGLGTKAQDLVIPFRLDEGENLPYFQNRALEIRNELILIKYQKGQINKLTGK